MKKIVGLLAFVIPICFTSLYSDSIADKIESFGLKEVDLKKMSSRQWHSANFSKACFVEIIDDLVVRDATPEEEGPVAHIFEENEIKYLGIDHGEFGGGLYVIVNGGERELLMNGNIRALIPLNGNLYVIEGLAHMGSDGGSVSVILDYNHPSKPERITLLPSAPQAVYFEDREFPIFIIAGSNSLIELIADQELTIIEHDAFWGGLYPTSIVKLENHYIIGIRSGVAVVTRVNHFQSTVRYFKK